MALFGSNKGFDIANFQRLLDQGVAKQKRLTEGAFSQLPQLTEQFQTQATQAGDTFAQALSKRAREAGTQLQNIESPDFLRQQQAKAQELAFRNLPAAQQQIRENLAATGGLGRGVAIRALSAPVLQAQQQAADTGFALQQGAAGRDIARREAAIDALFQADQQGTLAKFGIDKNIAQTLLDLGRSDILDRAAALAGIEAQRTQGLLDIEQLRQQQEIARDRAKQAQIGALLSTGGQLLGAGIGSFGGPAGISIGSQLGGAAGTALGGGQANFAPGLSDLASLLLARQRQQNAITPISQPIAPAPNLR